MAERTGFEPATPGVTGRYSNQLNYRSVVGRQSAKHSDCDLVGVAGVEPTACKAVALPTELNTRSPIKGAYLNDPPRGVNAERSQIPKNPALSTCTRFIKVQTPYE